jgi:microcystin-dependent protein
MSARLMRSGAAPMTGPIKVVDGSSGSPAVQFANATSTGLYKTTNGIGVSIGGTLVAEFGAGGLTRGGKFIGEIFAWTGSTAAALCVLPYGQTLSRATFADLWAFAQTEIAAGNTFYNNGNGTTTFGIGDLRGRVIAGKDNMGGTAAGRLTSSFFGADGKIIGSAAGLESNTLSAAQIPAHSHSGNTGTESNFHTHQVGGMSDSGQQVPTSGGAGHSGLGTTFTTGNNQQLHTHPFTTDGGAVGGGAHNNVQPTMILNFALFAGA